MVTGKLTMEQFSSVFSLNRPPISSLQAQYSPALPDAFLVLLWQIPGRLVLMVALFFFLIRDLVWLSNFVPCWSGRRICYLPPVCIATIGAHVISMGTMLSDTME